MTSARIPIIALALGATLTSAQPLTPATNFDVQKLADGVYAVIRKEPAGMMVDANNVFIINDEDVVVVDANGAPAITREVLSALRKLTSKPVRYVVNTHYHDDHTRGNVVYRDAFPGVEFVGHPFTREYMPAQGAVNRKGFLEGAPQFANQLRGMLKDNKSILGGELTPEERESMSSDVALADFVLTDSATTEAILPTVTVDKALTFKRGRRRIDVLHAGKGHTAADLVVHLPDDGILITGDLVVWPVPLVGDPQSNIGAWSGTLAALRALKPRTIVPGHGPVMHDDTYLATLQSMFASISQQAAAAVKRGETTEQARKSINLDEFRAKLAGESRVRQTLFMMYVARPAVAAAIREAGAK